MRPSALVVIDPQNHVLGEGGVSSKRHVEAAQLAAAIRGLVAAMRQRGRPVERVTSVDGDGELLARLKAEGVGRLVLCGVATDGTVRRTAAEARALSLDVDVVADACAAATQSKHLAALRDLRAMGVRTPTLGEVLSEPGEAVHLDGYGAGDTTLWCGALEAARSRTDLFEALRDEVVWNTMMHRGGEVPRRVAIQGLVEADGVAPLYRHPVDGQPPMGPFTPLVDAIRREVEARVGHPLNHGLLQLYRDGRDWISEHADKTLDLARPSFIVNVSLGRTRTMVLRPKRSEVGAPAAPERIPLPHGSMLVMGLGTNRTHYHAIRQEGARDDDGPRVSLTFRHIGTFHDAATGAVWGVGAPCADRAEATARSVARAKLTVDAQRQWARDEGTAMLTLFRDENLDPDFDAARYRPGFEVVDLAALNEPP
jgi:alkylated DNA repair dioxygenase AlkB